jgi:hypothetical protein
LPILILGWISFGEEGEDFAGWPLKKFPVREKKKKRIFRQGQKQSMPAGDEKKEEEEATRQILDINDIKI